MSNTSPSAAKQRLISFVLFVAFLVASIIFTYMVVKLDVRAVGPEGSSVGLSHLNELVHKLTGEHLIWYTITIWLGFIALFIAAGFAVAGCLQLATRKSFFKVDREIVALGFVYVIMLVLYIFFEFKVINYRPMLMPGMTALEASFPSSHTMLVCVIGGTAIVNWRQNKEMKGFLRSILIFFAYVLIVVTVIGRLISGCHWFTDIVAGILYSLTLVYAYKLVIIRGKEKKKPEDMEPPRPPKPEKKLTPYGKKKK